MTIPSYLASVIVPLWGRADRCLLLTETLVATTPPEMFELVLVDNGSADATPVVLAALGGDVQVARLEAGGGFAAAANQGAAIARGRHLVFLDSACQPSPGWLEPLLVDLEAHPQVGAVGPLLLRPGGEVFAAGLELARRADGGIEGWRRLPGHSRDLAGKAPVPAATAVAALSGMAMAVRREAFSAVGGFDETYRDANEDLDLCLSLAQAGWAVLCEPSSRVTVLGPTSRPADRTAIEADAARLTERWSKRALTDLTVGPEGSLSPVGEAVIPLENGSWGANVVGFFEAELGLGQSARLVVDALEAAGARCATSSYHRHFNRARHPFAHRRQGGSPYPYELNVLCLNADILPLFAAERGERVFPSRYSVAVWHWELEELPGEYARAAELVDEIWVGSTFSARSVARSTTKPVTTLPIAIPRREGRPRHSRDEVGIPPGFVFGFMFDVHSTPARKNPDGLISAFCRAFAPGEGPVLLVKTVNASRRPGLVGHLRALAGGRRDVVIVDGYLDPAQIESWTGLVDCYVSLHRSEGFGLTLAEAMSWGTPVVATGYSGNLDFMSESNSYLVPWTLGAVPPGNQPYPPGARWAEPDLAAAASILRRVWERPEEAARLGERGRADIRRTHSLCAAAAVVAQRLTAIEEHLATSRSVRRRPRPRSCRAAPMEQAGRPRRQQGGPLRLNLGAGEDRREGFVSVDLRAEVADLVASVDRLPVATGAATEILALDILEHFPAHRTASLLAEWHRVLAPGGKLTLRVPNLAALACLLVANPSRTDVIRNIYGGHRFGPDGSWDAHHTGWTPQLLHEQLAAAGFRVLCDDGENNNTVVAMALERAPSLVCR